MTRLGDPALVERAAIEFGRRAVAEGLVPVLVPFCRSDLPRAAALREEIGGVSELVNFWGPPIDEDLTRFLEEYSRLSFVVAERLHAAVLAAAMDVPFLALAYKPKCLDFVDSLGSEMPLALPYGELTGEALWRRANEGLRSGASEQIRASVAHYRQTLTQTATLIQGLLMAGQPSNTR